MSYDILVDENGRSLPEHDGNLSVFGHENALCHPCVIIGIWEGEREEDSRFLMISPEYAEMVGEALLREARAVRAGERMSEVGAVA